MGTDTIMLAFAYFRLSNEEAQTGESSSISNQRMLVSDYCNRNGITLVREFVDDGYSGGNFDRPAFRAMMRHVEEGKANTVLTKDLSRLGRDMIESSYYAEQYFPEHKIRYIATHDNFDSDAENVMAPFQFAMNEVYLRDGSRKVRNVLQSKRSHGEYCACPPYGYCKDPENKSRLIADENTAYIVKRIFELAAKGDSSRKIALELGDDGIIPPLKYRVLYRDNFSDRGAARASDEWNYTTVKRILKNPVYLGHTLLGKSKKVSVKSNKKVLLPEEKWSVTQNTHPPLVTQEMYDAAQKNLGRGTRDYRQYGNVRKSIFSGLVYCELCGYSLCSAGTVYKGEREKYWYLSCTHKRNDIPNPCPGTRIRYADLVELLKSELNSLISLSEADKEALVRDALSKSGSEDNRKELEMRIDKARARIVTIDKIIVKLYHDNAEGRIDDDRLSRMVGEFDAETKALKKVIAEANARSDDTAMIEENYDKFFGLVNRYSEIPEVDRDILQTFVDRIEIGPKVLPEGYLKATHDNTPYVQHVSISYKFIGDIGKEASNLLSAAGY